MDRRADGRRLVPADICFMGTAGYILLDYKGNGNITKTYEFHK
jgi:hypothetical protein